MNTWMHLTLSLCYDADSLVMEWRVLNIFTRTKVVSRHKVMFLLFKLLEPRHLYHAYNAKTHALGGLNRDGGKNLKW